MKTAAEFLEDSFKKNNGETWVDLMIEFAKMHVQAALKEVSEKAECYESMEGMYEIRTRTIINSYPESNIK